MNLSKLIIKWFSIVLLSMVSVESFAALQSHQQKFISKVLIEVRQANQEVQIRRAELKTLHHKWQTNHNLSAHELKKVEQLAALYRISGTNFSTEATWQKLLQRIDVLPESLVLAQAINESAWGKSRIAKSSNNFFGRSCFKTGCGLKPGKNNGSRHKFEYKEFASLSAPIKDYLHNINTHSAYDGLRKKRHVTHTDQKKLHGTMLATGLRRYSERGPVYIAMLQKITKNYKLEQFDTV